MCAVSFSSVVLYMAQEGVLRIMYTPKYIYFEVGIHLGGNPGMDPGCPLTTPGPKVVKRLSRDVSILKVCCVRRATAALSDTRRRTHIYSYIYI